MGHLKSFLGLSALIIFFGVLGVIFTPQLTSAEAGPGGGGGTSGCPSNYSTCTGAVWRYYKTNADPYKIPNVNPGLNGYTNVTGCSAYGGFFAYVLVNNSQPNNDTLVRSWKIGPNDDVQDKSEFFGGWTHYYVASNNSDPIPTNPTNGMYSWYSVKKAFLQTQALGQNTGYNWDGNSSLGWFCYQGMDFNLVPTISGTPSFVESGSASANTISLAPVVNNTGATTSTGAQWRVVTFNLAPSAGIPGGNKSNSAPEQFFGNGATAIASGTNAFPKNVTNLAVGQQTISDLPVGTRVCYALSVQPITQTDARWSHSNPFCVTIGKSPKIQILGNDLMVGRLFTGAAGLVPSSKIQTSVTKKATTSTTIPAPQSAFTGLWKTGVNSLGQKLPQNQSDSHWSIDRIIRPSGAPGATCQKAVGSNGSSLVTVPTTSANPRIASRTILENNNNTMAGMYIIASNPDVTGVPTDGVKSENGNYVWNRTSPYARWIGQNMYGQNYNNPNGCYDPTFNKPTEIDNANIYVFKLEGGFNIDPAANIDLDTARIRITGAADNRMKFVVNGQALDSNWIGTGWLPNSSATSGNKTNVFKNGQNSLELWVQSTASQTGLLIDDISIQATAQQPQANMFGSWTEYASVATGAVTGIGSGSAYAGGTSTTQTICGASLLTLSNTSTTAACSPGSSMGGYKTNRTIPDVAGTFETSSLTPTLPASTSLTNLSGLYKAPANLTITGGNIGLGKSVIINAPGSTVTITKDIKYSPGTMSNISSIPQVVIIAKDILIQGVNENTAVKQVDAWLIATGTINTCYDAGSSASLTINRCKARLTVNGPVMANKLLLWRTGGSESGAAASDPSEVFNLRPDAYLWGISQSSKSGRLETVYQRELPPRF